MKSAIKILICFLCLSSFVYARNDIHTYAKHLDNIAIWVNPKKIKVYVVPENKSEILTRAFKIWDGALRSDLNFVFVKDEKNADIVAKYVDKLDGTKLGITKTTYVTMQEKKYLYKAEVEVARKDNIGFTNNDAELLKVALHEIGHSIGIIGHSNSMNDLMYYSTASTKNTSPSIRDVDTVQKLYNFK